ncbi:hypothetical protein LN461_20415 [Xanthomonas arboricola]|uniref:hypothetical protein n=1 Tax=Xanthomonas TaxID=338 RepID=UPI00161DE728|nr:MULTISPECIES: hypothetical protein [Xanthomonas]MBB3813654.1 hypothetical protein [Xanthomonas euroxanthea]MCC8671697.1 hypothetical protein [Xanthomonas arboricola]
MDVDDKIRGKVGLVVCLRDMGNGTSRLFLDDVKGDNELNPITWKHDYFYTFSPELDNSVLEEMNLSSEQLERIGVAVVARLLALNNRVNVGGA